MKVFKLDILKGFALFKIMFLIFVISSAACDETIKSSRSRKSNCITEQAPLRIHKSLILYGNNEILILPHF